MSNYTWLSSSPHCLGLGMVLGYESSYRNSDMQFARETAEYLFESIKLTKSYQDRGWIDSSVNDFFLELNYRFVADMPDRLTSSEVSLHPSFATEPVRHGTKYSVLDFSEPRPESVKSETFCNRSYVLDSVYFDPLGTHAGFRLRDYSSDASNKIFDTKLAYKGVILKTVYNDSRFRSENFETKTRLVGFRTT